MIRQLPKLSVPAFVKNFSSTEESAPADIASDIKVYDVITPSTINNSEGNTMQLQLFHKDSELNEGVRELHGRLTLKTEQLPDKQDLNFGFVFASDAETTFFDGLQVLTRVDSSRQTQRFYHQDISTSQKLDIHTNGPFGADAGQNDWILLDEDSTITCEEQGKCEFSVAFVRNFDTKDHEQDIAILEGEERQYSFTGFYAATHFNNGEITHAGQSEDFYILMGALSQLTASSLVVASTVIALAAF